jgi:ketosteroid isomerase-like protein
MPTVDYEIREIINRETRAWNTKNVELLLTIFHPDMVWPWPPTADTHDPMNWIISQGRYNYSRWKEGWQHLFDTHELVHNKRVIQKIVVSKEGDGAFAVVDVDTLWMSHDGKPNHWKGRACKIYTKIGNEWKLIAHTGLLDYESLKSQTNDSNSIGTSHE